MAIMGYFQLSQLQVEERRVLMKLYLQRRKYESKQS
jgi:hypothetical protein